MNRSHLLLSTVILSSLSLVPGSAHAQRRAGGQSRGGESRGSAVARPSGSGRVYTSPAPQGQASRLAPRGGSRVVVGGPGRYRSYYTFRPRVSLGFGLWAGYPVAYPYYYGYSYPYPYLYPYGYSAYGYPAYGYPAYGYPPYGDPTYRYPAPPYGSPQTPYSAQPSTSTTIEAQPGQGASGGVSFEITPDTADVWVDGNSVGTVGMFGPSAPPLSLAPGRHRIQLKAEGYDSLAFSVDVTPGQVIPYRGTMQPQRP